MQARLGRRDGDGLVASRREHEHGVEGLGDEILPALGRSGVRKHVAGRVQRALGEVADRAHLESVPQLAEVVEVHHLRDQTAADHSGPQPPRCGTFHESRL